MPSNYSNYRYTKHVLPQYSLASTKHPSDSFISDYKINREDCYYRKGNDAIQLGSQKSKQPQQSKENHRQKDLIRKLNNLREQFKEVSDWNNVVNSILCTKQNKYEKNQYESNYRLENYKSRTPEAPIIQKFENQIPYTSKSNHLLVGSNVSNISFQIKETSSIDESKRKSKQCQKHTSYDKQPPVNQFKLYSHEFNNPSKYQKYGEVDKRIEMIENKIKNCQLKKKQLNIEMNFRKNPRSNSESNLNNFKLNKSALQACHKDGSNEKNVQTKFFNEGSSKLKKLSKPPKYPSLNNSKTNKFGKMDQTDISPRFAETQSKWFNTKKYPAQRPHSHLINRFSVDHQEDRNNTIENNRQQSSRLQVYNKTNYTNKKSYKEMPLSSAFTLCESQYPYSYNRNSQKQSEQRNSKNKHQIKKLVNALSNQVSLDEKFRNNKLWLDGCRKDTKWIEIQSILRQENINVSQQEVKAIFKLNQEEDNPFFSINSYQTDCRSVVKSFIAVEDHWDDKIQHKFCQKILQNEGFNQYSIDLDKKGYIILEDFVRFLNMQTGTFFRNRDLIPIFKKFSNKNKVSFVEIINILCK